LKAEQLKVATNSKPQKVAGAIAKILRDNKAVELYAIGASAVNQAVKAVAIASSYTEKELACVPTFCDVSFTDKVKTGIKITINVA
jgi:stage V sporulation protein S